AAMGAYRGQARRGRALYRHARGDQLIRHAQHVQPRPVAVRHAALARALRDGAVPASRRGNVVQAGEVRPPAGLHPLTVCAYTLAAEFGTLTAVDLQRLFGPAMDGDV